MRFLWRNTRVLSTTCGNQNMQHLYKKETFIIICFAELSLLPLPTPQPALPNSVSTQVMPMAPWEPGQSCPSLSIPQASRSERRWGMQEVSGLCEQNPRLHQELYLCVDLVNGFNACVLWKEENTIR